MKERKSARRLAGVTTVVAMVIALIAFVPSAIGGSSHVTGAAFTTTNTNVDGTGNCKNGNEAVNCNIYTGKQFVWLNGGPAAASLGDGTYFFAVLVPGGQGGHENPNDGTANNLSDPSGGDAWTCRIFDVSSGAVTYPGATTDCGSSAKHMLDSNKIRLMPYDDTTNPGGVYILAICKVPGTIATDNPPGAVPSDCKYDAFKVQAAPEVPEATAPSVSKTAGGSYDTSYTWGINKTVGLDTEVHQSSTSKAFSYTVTATHSAGTTSNISVSGTITVSNTNSDSIIVNVADALSDLTGCTIKDGTTTVGPSDDVVVPENGTKQLTYSCSIIGSVLPVGLSNTVNISWPEQLLDDGTHLAAGTAHDTVGNISFTQADTLNECTTVTDQLGSDPVQTLGVACVGGGWTPDAGNNLDSFNESYTSPTFTFTYSRTLTGTAGTCTTFDNNAVSTPNDGGATDNDGAEAKLCVGADLTASKTATPAFTRTYRWTIQKAVDKTIVRTSGTSATFNYTVTVNSGTPAYTDSGWQVSGSITVNNPNDWEAVSVNITDAVNNGGTCTVTNGTGVSVAASGSASRDYTCTWASAPSAVSGTNTATVSWDGSAANTPTSSATGTAGFSFSTPTTELYKTITVVDPAYLGGSPAGTLGTVAYGTTTLPAVFHYSHTITIDPTQCISFTNTATIVETNQSSSVTVRACPTVNGLTIGYWSNKNGQAKISGAASSGGVCSLTGWLRGTTVGSPFYTAGGGLGPFHDLNLSASCSAVATYVYNIIKSGSTNCSGSTCNPMLKAQLLATALNVFFPGITNGNEQIDLVHGCSMIDGSGGSGSCSGAESWSNAFGGATHLSVFQMLAYAASRDTSSLLNGSNWYGQVKSLQVLAKDAFDAINNSVALAF